MRDSRNLRDIPELEEEYHEHDRESESGSQANFTKFPKFKVNKPRTEMPVYSSTSENECMIIIYGVPNKAFIHKLTLECENYGEVQSIHKLNPDMPCTYLIAMRNKNECLLIYKNYNPWCMDEGKQLIKSRCELYVDYLARNQKQHVTSSFKDKFKLTSAEESGFNHLLSKRSRKSFCECLVEVIVRLTK